MKKKFVWHSDNVQNLASYLNCHFFFMQVKSKPIQNVNGHNLGKNLTQKQDNLAWGRSTNYR